ncbi:hypothetical protein EDD85DRAFT_792530 [Armillaria nabsnona]|nr:hypothetical protein EDD85DRAFT_792530 [Armillaria nabsnona]
MDGILTNVVDVQQLEFVKGWIAGPICFSHNVENACEHLQLECPIYDIRVVTLENDLGGGSTMHHGMLYANDSASWFNNLELLWHATCATYDIATACGCAPSCRTHPWCLMWVQAVIMLRVTCLLTCVFDIDLLLLTKQLSIPIADVEGLSNIRDPKYVNHAYIKGWLLPGGHGVGGTPRHSAIPYMPRQFVLYEVQYTR